jgi:hypothetical protein
MLRVGIREIEPMKSNREWLIQALRDLLARLSQDERHKLAAELGIVPVINVHFVDAEDGRPKRENRP